VAVNPGPETQPLQAIADRSWYRQSAQRCFAATAVSAVAPIGGLSGSFYRLPADATRPSRSVSAFPENGAAGTNGKYRPSTDVCVWQAAFRFNGARTHARQILQ